MAHSRLERPDPGQSPAQQLAESGSVGAQAEADPLPLAPPLHEPFALECLQMAGRARLGQPDGDRKLADAAIRLGQGPYQAETRCHSQAGEEAARTWFLQLHLVHCMEMHITPDD